MHVCWFTLYAFPVDIPSLRKLQLTKIYRVGAENFEDPYVTRDHRELFRYETRLRVKRFKNTLIEHGNISKKFRCIETQGKLTDLSIKSIGLYLFVFFECKNLKSYNHISEKRSFSNRIRVYLGSETVEEW